MMYSLQETTTEKGFEEKSETGSGHTETTKEVQNLCNGPTITSQRFGAESGTNGHLRDDHTFF